MHGYKKYGPTGRHVRIMRTRLVRGACFGVLGATLVHMGYGLVSPQFWTVIVVALILILNEDGDLMTWLRK